MDKIYVFNLVETAPFIDKGLSTEQYFKAADEAYVYQMFFDNEKNAIDFMLWVDRLWINAKKGKHTVKINEAKIYQLNENQGDVHGKYSMFCQVVDAKWLKDQELNEVYPYLVIKEDSTIEVQNILTLAKLEEMYNFDKKTIMSFSYDREYGTPTVDVIDKGIWIGKFPVPVPEFEVNPHVPIKQNSFFGYVKTLDNINFLIKNREAKL